ncbi:23S rRNA (adenine(1618)-N(6))-methyltransferase RlmF (plasmid) [Pseudoalteromonas sp. T1lg65]|uniref:23S rRNA (adenine(1618)-N(6))-methyltransferase RlmF n=1 Tax=Pseudoalteromonas sp. T1lg65 TaxID=2077101 RepID=UPI003F7B03CB
MHARNRHRFGYDFDKLLAHEPELVKHIKMKIGDQRTIDFSDPTAVKVLNSALLKSEYGLRFWDIPEQFLCPPVPGRADYIHALYDLLAEDNLAEKVSGLDIGTGANLIYPIIGYKEYGWKFTASEINPISVKCAKAIAQLNNLPVKVLLQKNTEHFFQNIVKSNQSFHFSMCNPPFHTSAEEAQQGTNRKWKNLNIQPSDKLNFGGQAQELWCRGGEKTFITAMIKESKMFSEQVFWFTSLVSSKDTLPFLKTTLKQVGAKRSKVVNMQQGNKASRFVAWSFY